MEMRVKDEEMIETRMMIEVRMTIEMRYKGYVIAEL